MAETSEMVDRVARAIEHALACREPLGEHDIVSRELAVAAIKAMRESTAPMAEQGEYAHRDGNAHEVREIWSSMIDAALPSPPDPA